MRTLAAAILALTGAAIPAAAQQTAPDCHSPPEAEPGSGRVHVLREVDVPPRIDNSREFRLALARRYPAAARDAGVQGWVNVCFVVEADGSISNAVVMRATDEQFEQPTLDAVSVMRFRPARLDGRPVRVWVVQPIQWMVHRYDPAAARERERDRRFTHPEEGWRPTLSDRLYGKNRPYPPTPASGNPPPPPR
jgi:TonB family protein